MVILVQMIIMMALIIMQMVLATLLAIVNWRCSNLRGRRGRGRDAAKLEKVSMSLEPQGVLAIEARVAVATAASEGQMPSVK